MARDLLDRFTPIHSHPINIGGGIATWRLVAGHRALSFVRNVIRTAYFASVMNSLYNGSGITVTVVWASEGTTAGVTWRVAFERQQAGVFNFASSDFTLGKTVVSAAPVATWRAVYSQIQFAASDLAGLSALESYRLTLTRSDAVDLDAYVYRVFLQNRT